MSAIHYLVLFLLPIIGGLLALMLRKVNPLHLKLLLSFSGAYLFGITILHMMPEAFAENAKVAGEFILVGFLIQVALDQFSQGVEHGHIHTHKHVSTGYLWSIMVGLSVHAFIEGIPLSNIHDHAGHFHSDSFDLQPLLFGIAVHKIPAAFALVSIFIFAGLSKAKSFTLLIIFAAVTPIASLLTYSVTGYAWMANSMIVTAIVATVIGSFLHISTTILFEVSTRVHQFNMVRFVAILIGLIMAILTVF